MEKLKALLLLILAVIFFSCKMDSDNKFAPDIVSIMNFTNYSSIGVASKSVTSSRSARAISTDAVDILVGINKNTELLEKVSFISSDDSESDSDFNVCAYQDTTPFLFIQFSIHLGSVPWNQMIHQSSTVGDCLRNREVSILSHQSVSRHHLHCHPA